MAAGTTAAEIRPATIAQLQEHAGEAIKQNHAETGNGTLAVDWQRLQFLENAGCAVILAAWVGDKIVGYSVAFALDQVNSNDRYCHGHVIFVMQKYRGGTDLGRRLFRATEGAADAQGCCATEWHFKPGSPGAKLALSMGYREGDRVYSKELG